MRDFWTDHNVRQTKHGQELDRKLRVVKVVITFYPHRDQLTGDGDGDGGLNISTCAGVTRTPRPCIPFFPDSFRSDPRAKSAMGLLPEYKTKNQVDRKHDHLDRTIATELPLTMSRLLGRRELVSFTEVGGLGLGLHWGLGLRIKGRALGARVANRCGGGSFAHRTHHGRQKISGYLG